MTQRTILECTVGSRLHGTATAESDTDVREIHVSDLAAMLDPFRTQKGVTATSVGTGAEKVETTRYELKHFLYYLRQGNPTFVEVMTSDLVTVNTKTGRTMQQRWRDFIDPEAFRRSHLGYLNDVVKKTDAFSELNDPVKAGKQLSAGIIAGWRAIQIIKGGDDFSVWHQDLHRKLKEGDHATITNARLDLYSITATTEYLTLWARPEDTVDEAEIARFCYNVYRQPE